MNDKKVYQAPQIRTEVIKVGVFGTYGSNGGGNSFSPIAFANPFFRFCCS